MLRGANSDPYTFYSVLNNVKNNLIWGMTDNEEGVNTEGKVPVDNAPWFVPCLNGKISQGETSTAKDTSTKGHVRRISSVSSASVVSSVGEQECERFSDAGDSGVESEEAECLGDITSTLKTHLVGLHNCLSQLAETAAYITDKYQEEVSA